MKNQHTNARELEEGVGKRRKKRNAQKEAKRARAEPVKPLNSLCRFCYIDIVMADTKRVFQVVCPCCQTTLWVDGETREVLQSERAKKKKSSLDDLVSREVKRAGEMGRKFDATFELQAEKKQKADEKFRQALEKAEKEGPEET